MAVSTVPASGATNPPDTPPALIVTMLKWPAGLLQVVPDWTETLIDGTMPATPQALMSEVA